MLKMKIKFALGLTFFITCFSLSTSTALGKRTCFTSDEPHHDRLWEHFLEKKSRQGFSPQTQKPRPKNLEEKMDFHEVGAEVNYAHSEHFRALWGNNINYETRKYFWQDENSNGLPDAVDQALTAAERSWATLITDANFRVPEHSQQYYLDIYFADTVLYHPEEGYLNLCHESAFANTYHDGTPYIVIAPDLGIFQKKTLAHELFHTIQFAYKNLDDIDSITEFWWYEASAVWAEERVYPDENRYVSDVNSWMNSPLEPLWATSGNREYGGFLWAKYLTQRFADEQGEDEKMRELWTLFEEHSLFEAFDQSLAEQSIASEVSGVHDAFADFAAQTVYPPNFYEDGRSFSALATSHEIEHSPQIQTFQRSNSAHLWGINHFQIIRRNEIDEDFLLHFDGEEQTETHAILWKINLTLEMATGEYMNLGTFTPDQYGYQKLVLSPDLPWTKAHLLIIPLTQALPQRVENAPQVLFNLDFNTNETPSLVNRQEHRHGVSTQISVEMDGGFQMQLNAGWNLVGWPFPDQSRTVRHRLASILPYSKSIWVWNVNEWELYHTKHTDIEEKWLSSFKTLVEIPAHSGFWINMKRAATLHIPQSAGSLANDSSAQGWHLLTSYQTPWSDFGIQAEIPATLWWWNEGEWEHEALDVKSTPIANFPNGKGFWVRIHE